MSGVLWGHQEPLFCWSLYESFILLIYEWLLTYFSNPDDGTQKARPSSKMLCLTYTTTRKDWMSLQILFERKLAWSAWIWCLSLVPLCRRLEDDFVAWTLFLWPKECRGVGALEIPRETDCEFYKTYLEYKWVTNHPLMEAHHSTFWSLGAYPSMCLGFICSTFWFIRSKMSSRTCILKSSVMILMPS